MKKLALALLFLWPSVCLPFTGDWYIDTRNSDVVEKVVRKDFAYLNQKITRYIDKTTSADVLYIYRNRRLTDAQISYVLDTAGEVPLEPIVGIEDTVDNLTIRYASQTRVVPKTIVSPVQLASDMEFKYVVMIEADVDLLIIETIVTSGAVIIEQFNTVGTQLCSQITVTSPRLNVPLVIQRYYTNDVAHGADRRICRTLEGWIRR